MIRLRRLDLEMFGQFTDKSYDFGPRPETGCDFHIVHGANEAGKTTTMEGFLRLLYGFPLREPYAFRHERKSLRVSGLLDLGDRDLSLTRLPRRDAPLVDITGNALPEQTLAAHLGGLAQDDYRNLLCLDDDTIERGGEEIASAKGDIGRLLFSAAAGIGDLTAVLDGVRAEAEALYKKRSGKTRMAELKRALADIDKRIRDEDVSASAYRTLRQALHRASEDEGRAATARTAHATDQARLRARRAALPLLAEIADCDTVIAAHPDFPARLDVDPETLIAMQTDQRLADTDLTRLNREIADVVAERDGIVRDEQGLALSGDLDGLDDLRSRFATAAQDLPKRRRALDEVRDDMRRLARDLGLPDTIDPERLIVSQGQLAQLEKTREAARETGRAAAAESDEIAQLDERIGAAQAALDRVAPDGDAGIDALLHRFSADTLATRHATATQAVAEARRQAEAARDALTLGEQRFDTLPPCPISPAEAADLAEDHSQMATELRTADRDLAEMETRIDEADAQIAALSQAEGLVADSAAQALFDRREALWQSHRTALTIETALPFETAMRAVDGAAAARLARARDLGQLRQLDQDAARLRARKAQAVEARAALKARHDRIAARIAEAAAQVGIARPLSPAVFAAWLPRLTEAQEAARRQSRVRADHADTFARADGLTQALAPHLDLAHPEFDTLLDAARRRASEERAARQSRAAATAQLEELRGEKQRRTARHRDCAAAAKTAETQWHEAVNTAFGGCLSAGVLNSALAPLRSLRELETRRAATARQIAGMEADQRDFIQALAALALPACDLAPLETFAALQSRARTAAEAETRHAALCQSLIQLETARDDTRRARERIAARAETIAQAFPPDTPTATLGDLRRAVDLGAQVIAARTRHAALRAQVCTLLDAADLDAARRQLDGVTAPDLDARLSQIEADSPMIEDTYREAIAARSAAARDLRAVTGDADIALLTQRKATLELELRDAALASLELHFGHDLAEEAIRRYRDAHRSGMMQAAETAFADLTNGAYTQLRSLPEGANETLIALDPAGQSKRAEDMSKGTRFQLYLALRAAAYDQLAAQGTVLPFFCDDIFETFDEDRTRAACRLMARIGRTGQAIYLTHHAHVVDLAREVCGDGVRVHNLA